MVHIASPLERRHRLRHLLKNAFFRLYRLCLRCGFHLIPDHYYASLPNILDLERTRESWAGRSELPGISIDVDEQVESLTAVCLPYKAEYLSNAIFKEAVSRLGSGYGYIEAQVLHAVIRSYKPRRIIEVGSGVSTYCMAAASRLNSAEGGSPCHIMSIEPFPSDGLKALSGIILKQVQVQSVPVEAFTELEQNDLLFIDSSHAVRPGGDVNYLVLEILPRLRPGVVVHFHDICFPYDYQRDLLHTCLFSSETSLLRAFLISNDRVKILFSLSLLHYDRAAVLKTLFPGYDPQPSTDGLRSDASGPDQHFPSSIYLQIRAQSESRLSSGPRFA